MNNANRKSKLSRYEVVVRREVEYVTTLKVTARNLEEACDIATNIIDAQGEVHPFATNMIGGSVKAKVLRG